MRVPARRVRKSAKPRHRTVHGRNCEGGEINI